MSVYSAPDARRDLRPVDASSVLLLRPGLVCPEVFLLERHGKSAFMGGAFVFPGGKLDLDDRTDRLLARTRFDADLDRQEASPGRAWSAVDARAAAVAALRELFEEAGICLARRRGSPDLIGSGVLAPQARRALHEGERAWLELLEAADLELAADQLVYFDHWITPSAERRRFDARFFLAPMPGGQTASSDQRETVSGLWTTPRAAIDKHEWGEVFVPPPTLRMLQILSTVDSVPAALALARGRTVEPILPRMGTLDGKLAVHLPWSPEYAELEGEGHAVTAAEPGGAWPSAIAIPSAEDRPAPPEIPEPARAVLQFWFGDDLSLDEAPEAVAARWWRKDPELDAEMDRRFGELRASAMAGDLDAWQASPEASLALVLLLDQVSRNVFRGSPRAFEADPRAVLVAEAAIARGFDLRVSPMLRAFFYMPLMHAEDLERQDACRLAFERLAAVVPAAENTLRYSLQHREIIELFGRFPHRNEVLGRANTEAEAAWFAAGNSGF